MRTEDGHIIRKCLNGEPEAFGFLVDKYKGAIYAFAYAKLCNFHDAEDVTQEVFTKAYQKLRTLRRWDNFHAWIYSITSNLCKNWIRARANRPDGEFIVDHDHEILTRHSESSYREEPMDEPLYEILSEALDSLPEGYRQVLTFYYLGGMSSYEIAEFLGTSPANVRLRLSRARSRLKEDMVAMMSTTLEAQRLPATFTFRIVEAAKRIKIHPTPRAAGLPWGLSLAAGIILAILSLGSHLSLSHFMNPPMDSTLPDEMAVAEAGEIPVDVLKFSRMPIMSGQQGNDYAGGITLPAQQNAVLLAPRGEGDEWPDEPAARLGKGSIQGIAYSPDGKLLAVGGSRGIWLYGATDLSEVGLLKGHTGRVWDVTFSPDGKLLASGGEDETVRLWDVDGQKQVDMLRHTGGGWSVVFSSDGRLLASSGEDIRIWDVQQRKQVSLFSEHTGYVQSVTFSPDDKLLASVSSDKTVRLWDIIGQKQVGVLRGHTNTVVSVAFSPDGSLLVSGGAKQDRTLRFWDVVRQEQVDMQEYEAGVGSLAFSPDGELLVAGMWDATIRLWDVQRQEQIGLLSGHVGHVGSLAFSPDGKLLASVGGWPESTVRLWDVQEEEQIGMLGGYTGMVCSGAFSPDGELLAYGSHDGSIRLWDIQKQKQVGLLPDLQGWGSANSVAFSPDGRLLASAKQWWVIHLWDIQKKGQAAQLEHTDKVLAVDFSPDGKLLASASRDHTAHIWDVQEQKQVASLQHGADVLSAAFSPDGKTLATAGDEAIIRLWDVETQKQVGVLRGHPQWLYTVVFSPDGKLLASGGGDNTIRLWDVQQQKQVGLLSGHANWIYSLAFSPDGKLLASGSKDTTIRIWDVQEQKQVKVLTDHASRVYFVDFTNDGKWFASGSYDGTVMLWEVNLPSPFSMEPEGKQLGTWGEVKKTELHQNFPNPFNPETWIPFSLSDSKHVKISIYTSTGQLVRTLDLGQKPSGAYLSKEKAAYWDGRNEAGETVASDVYFYSMEAGEYASSRKMIIVR